jgi:hypothetical protein
MPLNKKGATIMRAMKEQYGEEAGEKIFYASKNAGKIEGVDGDEIADADGRLWSRGVSLSDLGPAELVLDAKGSPLTQDGYLKAMARVSRVGLQKYKGKEVDRPSMDSVILYRPEAEVFSRDALHSMANKPVTLYHPPKMVNASSWTKYAKGISGEDIVRDGEFVRVPLMLTDQETIDAHRKDGIREMSVGYTTDIDWTPGETPEGEHFDGIQRNIRANHHALVPVARGGRKLRFGDYDPGQPRGEDGKWTHMSSGHPMSEEEANADLAQMRQKQYISTGGVLPKRPDLGMDPEDWDDNDINSPTTSALMNPGRPGIEPIPPMPNVKIPPGSPFLIGADAADKGNTSMAMCKDCGSTMSMKDGKYICDRCLGTTKFDGDDMPVADAASFVHRQAGAYLIHDRNWSSADRAKATKTGSAMPGGRFPIEDPSDVRAAVHLWQSGHGQTSAVKAHIITRAHAVGATGELPDDWKSSSTKDAEPSERKDLMMPTEMIDGVSVAFADEISAQVAKRAFSNLQRQLTDARKAKDDVEEEQENEKKTRGATEDGYKKAVAAKDGEIAVLRQQLADAQSASSVEMQDAALKEREALKETVKKIVPSMQFDGKSNAQIRRDVVSAKLGDAAKALNDDAIEGAFKAIVTTAPSGGGLRTMAQGLSHGARFTDTSSVGDAREAALAEKINWKQNAWKTPPGNFFKSN